MQRSLGLIFGVAILALSAVACGGGSTSPGAGIPATQTQSQAHPEMKMLIPTKGIRASRVGTKFVSSATQSVTVAVDTAAPTEFSAAQGSVSANGSFCGNAGPLTSYSCTYYLAGVTYGTHTFSIVAYDGANATGNIIGMGSVTQDIVSGGGSVVPVTIGGVASSISVVPVPPATTPVLSNLTTATSLTMLAGSSAAPSTQLISVVALDADGNYIVGPGEPTITAVLSSPSPAGSTAISYASPVPATPNQWTIRSTDFGSATITFSAVTDATQSNAHRVAPLGNGSPTSTIAYNVDATAGTDVLSGSIFTTNGCSGTSAAEFCSAEYVNGGTGLISLEGNTDVILTVTPAGVTNAPIAGAASSFAAASTGSGEAEEYFATSDCELALTASPTVPFYVEPCPNGDPVLMLPDPTTADNVFIDSTESCTVLLANTTGSTATTLDSTASCTAPTASEPGLAGSIAYLPATATGWTGLPAGHEGMIEYERSTCSIRVIDLTVPNGVTVLDPTGVGALSTCGVGSAAEADGAPGTATFNFGAPVLGYDASTNMVYVLDFTGSSNCGPDAGTCNAGLVRRITPTGTVSTVATFGTGNQVGFAGQLPFPNDFPTVQAFDAANRSLLYIPSSSSGGGTGLLEVRL